MIAHIIHDSRRKERLATIIKETTEQGIEYRLWPAVIEENPWTGIMKAHTQIVRWAKEQGLPEVLIMEDDVRFCGPGSFDYFLKTKPAEFDLYLAGIYHGSPNRENRVKKFSALHCYIIRACFYDTFLAAPEDKHLDYYLSDFVKNGRYYVCNPFTAIQYNGYSIQKKRVMNYNFLLQGRSLYKNFTI